MALTHHLITEMYAATRPGDGLWQEDYVLDICGIPYAPERDVTADTITDRDIVELYDEGSSCAAGHHSGIALDPSEPRKRRRRSRIVLAALVNDARAKARAEADTEREIAAIRETVSVIDKGDGVTSACGTDKFGNTHEAAVVEGLVDDAKDWVAVLIHAANASR